MSDKAKVVPAVASAIIPGLGQLLKGHLFKAILFWGGLIILKFALGWVPLFWIISGLAWLINVLDAAFSESSGN